VTVPDFLTFVIVRLHLFNRRERGERRGYNKNIFSLQFEYRNRGVSNNIKIQMFQWG
jgi:hypothetical protein